jgi:HD-like signal output (HDOD) protein
LVQAKECGKCRRIFRGENDFLTHGDRFRICNRGFFWFNCSCGSTLLAKREQVPWYSPDAQLRPGTRKLYEVFKGKVEIPLVSSTVGELHQMLGSDAPVEAIVKKFKDEPMLSAAVLIVANQRKAFEQQAIDSIKHALIFVGYVEVQDIVMLASVTMFQFKTKFFAMKDFWRESYISGFLAEFFNDRLALGFDPDQPYLAGCLSNVGKVISAIAFPKETDEIFARISQPKNNEKWHGIERELLPAGHSTLGEIAAAHWGFPKYLVDAISEHHNRNDLFRAVKITLPDLVATSTQLAHRFLGNIHLIDNGIVNSFMKKLNVDDDRLTDLMKEAADIYRKCAV